MTRQFPYYVEPDEIRAYLTGLGYKTEDIYDRENKKILGFRIQDTAVFVEYDLISNGRWIAQRGISLRNHILWSGGDPVKEEQSLRLYQKLYRRFRKRPRKE